MSPTVDGASIIQKVLPLKTRMWWPFYGLKRLRLDPQPTVICWLLIPLLAGAWLAPNIHRETVLSRVGYLRLSGLHGVRGQDPQTLGLVGTAALCIVPFHTKPLRTRTWSLPPLCPAHSNAAFNLHRIALSVSWFLEQRLVVSIKLIWERQARKGGPKWQNFLNKKRLFLWRLHPGF